MARLVPEVERKVVRDQNAIDDAIRKIKELRKEMPRLTIEEILSARHDGHKY